VQRAACFFRFSARIVGAVMAIPMQEERISCFRNRRRVRSLTEVRRAPAAEIASS